MTAPTPPNDGGARGPFIAVPLNVDDPNDYWGVTCEKSAIDGFGSFTERGAEFWAKKMNEAYALGLNSHDALTKEVETLTFALKEAASDTVALKQERERLKAELSEAYTLHRLITEVAADEPLLKGYEDQRDQHIARHEFDLAAIVRDERKALLELITTKRKQTTEILTKYRAAHPRAALSQPGAEGKGGGAK